MMRLLVLLVAAGFLAGCIGIGSVAEAPRVSVEVANFDYTDRFCADGAAVSAEILNMGDKTAKAVRVSFSSGGVASQVAIGSIPANGKAWANSTLEGLYDACGSSDIYSVVVKITGDNVKAYESSYNIDL